MIAASALAGLLASSISLASAASPLAPSYHHGQPLNPMAPKQVPQTLTHSFQLNNMAQPKMLKVNSATSLANKLKVEATSSANSTTSVQYYGGPVLSNVEVTSIFYGNVANQREITSLYADLVNSTDYLSVLSQYNTTTQSIGKGAYKAGWIASSNLLTFIDNSNYIVPFLRSFVQQGLIKPTTNTYLPLHVAKETVIGVGNLQSCRDFCALHSTYCEFPHAPF